LEWRELGFCGIERELPTLVIDSGRLKERNGLNFWEDGEENVSFSTRLVSINSEQGRGRSNRFSARRSSRYFHGRPTTLASNCGSLAKRINVNFGEEKDGEVRFPTRLVSPNFEKGQSRGNHFSGTRSTAHVAAVDFGYFIFFFLVIQLNPNVMLITI
jgi:hypothetical protein